MATGFTIADVLAWARTKPADEEYEYCSNDNCAVAQFLKETGRSKEPSVDPFFWTDNRGKERRIDPLIDDAATPPSMTKQTFGEFAKRLELASA